MKATLSISWQAEVVIFSRSHSKLCLLIPSYEADSMFNEKSIQTGRTYHNPEEETSLVNGLHLIIEKVIVTFAPSYLRKIF